MDTVAGRKAADLALRNGRAVAIERDHRRGRHGRGLQQQREEEETSHG
jgi:hypothetical protein